MAKTRSDLEGHRIGRLKAMAQIRYWDNEVITRTSAEAAKYQLENLPYSDHQMEGMLVLCTSRRRLDTVCTVKGRRTLAP